MKLGADGFWQAETFEEHMHPDIVWCEDPAFELEFFKLAEDRGERVDYDTANLQFVGVIKVPLTRTGSYYTSAAPDPYKDSRVHGVKP